MHRIFVNCEYLKILKKIEYTLNSVILKFLVFERFEILLCFEENSNNLLFPLKIFKNSNFSNNF